MVAQAAAVQPQVAESPIVYVNVIALSKSVEGVRSYCLAALSVH
jgi:hypothetical protein